MPSRVLRAFAWTFPRWHARRLAARRERELEERRATLRAWGPLPKMPRERPDGGRGLGLKG